MIKSPRTKRIPDIISVDEVQKLIMATDRLSYRVFFFTLYSMGLRLGEGLRLQIGDINATHHRVHIRNAKGNKDRLVPLPRNTLRILRRFWSLHRHPQFLFPSRKRGLEKAHQASMPMDRGGVQGGDGCLLCARWDLKKRFPAIHSATAMQLTFWRPVLTWSNCSNILGHASLLTTVQYTHLTALTNHRCVVTDQSADEWL